MEPSQTGADRAAPARVTAFAEAVVSGLVPDGSPPMTERIAQRMGFKPAGPAVHGWPEELRSCLIPTFDASERYGDAI